MQEDRLLPESRRGDSNPDPIITRSARRGVMDDKHQPGTTRLQAADRIVERILGKVGEQLLVQQRTRTEVTVRYDVERLLELVSELQRMGAIGGHTVGPSGNRPPTPPPGRFRFANASMERARPCGSAWQSAPRIGAGFGSGATLSQPSSLKRRNPRRPGSE
jgi:hypothetical protein